MITAKGVTQWTRALVRTAVGSADRSKFVQTTKAKKIDIKLDRKMPYELDGGDEKPVEAAEDPGRAGRGHDLRPGGGVMSVAHLVPETWELDGDDARETLAPHRADAARAATRSCASARPTASATRARWRS